MTPISTLTILFQSMRALLRRWPVVLSLYGATFLLVLPVVLAFRATLAAAFSVNPNIDLMFSGFDYTVYTDFLATYSEAVDVFRRTLGPFIIVSIFLHAVFGAGVVAAVAGDGTTAEFLRGTGRFLGRSVRLFLYVVVLAVVVLMVWSFGVMAVWGAMTSGNVIESQTLTAAVVVALLFLLPVAIISLGAEYARVIIVREDRRKVVISFLEGLQFVVQHPLRMMLQHGTILMVMVGFVLLYWLVEGEVGMTTSGGVVTMLFIQQISILLRISVRVWHTTSAVMLVDAVAPEVPNVPAAPAVPAPSAPLAPPAVIQSAPLPVESPAKKVVRRTTKAAAPKVRRPVRRTRSK